MIIAIVVVIAGWRYPFLPRHLTIVSTFTIGIPGFFLALAPNSQRYVPGFILRVLRFTIPAGTVAASAALVAYSLARYANDLPVIEARTTAALVLSAVGLWILVLQARPFNWWKTLLVASMVAAVAIILVVPALPRLLRAAAPTHEHRARGCVGGCDRRRAAGGGLAVQSRRRTASPLRRSGVTFLAAAAHSQSFFLNQV